MRKLLEQLGLVRSTTPPDVWRQLIQRAIHHGEERRKQQRVPMDAAVALDRGESQGGPAFLVDISNRGCRLLSEEPRSEGDPIEVELDLTRFGGETLRLTGRVVRAHTDTATDGRLVTTLGVLFDPTLPEASRYQLATLLNRFTAGPGSLVTEAPGATLPPAESTEFPGLMLDEETDPAVAANLTVAVRAPGAPGEQAGDGEEPGAILERRGGPRASFGGQVMAVSEHHHRVLLGRDLSSRGMRIAGVADLAIGNRFRLALYNPGDPEPVQLRARVERDDGEDGLMLAFEDMGPEQTRAVEKIMACLPSVAVVGEGSEAGSVLSEMLGEPELD